MDDRVAQFLGGLSPQEYGLGVDGVGIVAPVGLDAFGEFFGIDGVGARGPDDVDEPVVQDPVEPGRGGGVTTEVGRALQGAHHGVLHEVLGRRGIPGQDARVAQQARDGGRDLLVRDPHATTVCRPVPPR